MFYLRFLTVSAVFLFLVISCASKPSDSGSVKDKGSSADLSKARILQSKKLGKEFGGALQKELKNAIKTKGLASAISVCKGASARYEEDFRKKSPDIISFRRVSVKARNVDSHTPTDKESDWLIKMASGMAKGIKPSPGVLEGDNNSFTVLLPIAIKKELCLKCHGDSSKFSKGLTDALKKNYPQDKATGFKMGDLRGALAIEWKGM